MIDPRRIAIIAAVLVALTLVSVTVDRWWSGQKLDRTAEIAELHRAIAVRDLKIKGQDLELARLKHRDSVSVDAIAHTARQLASTKAELATARTAIDVEASTHAGLVSIAAVHQLEAKDDSTIASCEHLNAEKDTRIGGLLAQIANQATTRTEMDTTRTESATILKDTVAVLKPPWIKRTVGWVSDHAVTLLVGAVGGFVLAKR